MGKQGGGDLPLVQTVAGRDSLPRPGLIELHPLLVIWLSKCLIAQVDSHPLDWTSGSNKSRRPPCKRGPKGGTLLESLPCFRTPHPWYAHTAYTRWTQIWPKNT
jgi:hypothetical protein